MDTLVEYHVPWTHVRMEDNAPSTELDHYILGEMCEQAAIGVELQCGREYWQTSEENVRATQVHKLSENERKNLPTNNLNTERYLAKFGYLAAQSAQHSNKFFKAKRIKDDLMFSEKSTSQPATSSFNKPSLSVFKHLDRREEEWTADQKAKKATKLEDTLAKKAKANEFVDRILKRCKEHNGPLTSVEELKKLVENTEDKQLQTFLRQEIQFQRTTHQADVAARRSLYLVNGLTVSQMIENLTNLLSDDVRDEGTDIIFPCEDEILDILKISRSNSPQESGFTPNQPLAVIWDDGESRNWYIGFYLGQNEEGEIKIEHLERVDNKDSTWQQPNTPDIQSKTLPQQIMPINVVADWDFNGRKPYFVVENVEDVCKVYADIN